MVAATTPTTLITAAKIVLANKEINFTIAYGK